MIKGSALVKEWGDFLETGDEKAFYALYEHYHGYLTYIGLQKGIAPARVKDHINDLFLYIFEHRHKLSHIKSHHNYLVTSFIRNIFRKEHFAATEGVDLSEENFPEMPSYPSTEAIYIQEHSRKAVKDIVQSYIAQLSESQARIIYQKFYLGLSYPEIAAANNITVKTAYNTIQQAISKLKKLIPTDQANAIAAAITLLSGIILIFLKIS